MLDNFANHESKNLILINSDNLLELAQILVEETLKRTSSEADREAEKTFITQEAACKMLGKDRSTLYQWDKKGYLKKIKVGSSVRYRLSDVLKVKEGKR